MLPEQECGQRAEHPGDDQPAQRTDPAERGHHDEGRHERHRRRDQQRGQNGAEHQIGVTERDPGQAVAGHRRQQDRAGGLQHRDHDRVPQAAQHRHGRVVEQFRDVAPLQHRREERPLRRGDVPVGGQPVAQQQVVRDQEDQGADPEHHRPQHHTGLLARRPVDPVRPRHRCRPVSGRRHASASRRPSPRIRPSTTVMIAINTARITAPALPRPKSCPRPSAM